MSLGELIEAAGNLSPEERIKLVEEVAKMLRKDIMKKNANFKLNCFDISTFWEKKTISELVREQRVVPFNQLEDLTADFWPENESTDEMIEVVYSLRRLNKQRGMC